MHKIFCYFYITYIKNRVAKIALPFITYKKWSFKAIINFTNVKNDRKGQLSKLSQIRNYIIIYYFETDSLVGEPLKVRYALFYIFYNTILCYFLIQGLTCNLHETLF